MLSRQTFHRNPSLLRENLRRSSFHQSRATSLLSDNLHIPAALLQDASRFQKLVDSAVESRYFDAVIGLLLFANAVTLAIEQELQEQEDSAAGRVFQRLDLAFLGVFTVELWLRLVNVQYTGRLVGRMSSLSAGSDDVFGDVVNLQRD